MADKNTNEMTIVDFDLFDGVEIRGVGIEKPYPELAGKPLGGTAKIERDNEGSSHPTLNVSLF